MANRIVELRRYTLKPGSRAGFIDLFERELLEPQEKAGMSIDGLFRDPDRPDVFVWMRSFPDMEARRRSLEAFYGGPIWRVHRDAANACIVDSDDVLLLDGPQPRADLRGPLFCAVYPRGARLEARHGMRVVGTWTSEESENTFPRLPVRRAQVLVALVDGGDRESLAATNPEELFELVPTARSRMQLRFDATPGDFAFLDGRWKVRHRILRRRLQGCAEWDDVAGHAMAHTLLGGLVSVDEIDFGARGRGTSFRHLDVERRRWSIYWVNDRTGALFPPVHGGFHGDGCELFGRDREGGRDVFVRYKWTGCGTQAPRWEQAFSLDGGGEWETNWIMEFSR